MPDLDHDKRIVSDGRKQILQSPDYEATVEKIRSKYWHRYREESSGLSLLERTRLRFRLWRAMRKEVDRVAPAGGNYLHAPTDTSG